MDAEFTIKINEHAYRRAERFAEVTGQSIEQVIQQTLESSLPELPEPEQPLAELSDEEVLALAQLQLSDEFGKRNSELLDRQQAGLLIDSERLELQQMTWEYQIALLRKSQGIREAAERGLKLDL